jgi:cytochrome c5
MRVLNLKEKILLICKSSLTHQTRYGLLSFYKLYNIVTLKLYTRFKGVLKPFSEYLHGKVMHKNFGAKRIFVVGVFCVVLTGTTAANETVEGAAIYNYNCVACHSTGVDGAPKIGDQAAWAPRIKRGLELLVEHAISGYEGDKGYMPPKGGNISLSDAEIRSAIDYILSVSSGNNTSLVSKGYGSLEVTITNLAEPINMHFDPVNPNRIYVVQMGKTPISRVREIIFLDLETKRRETFIDFTERVPRAIAFPPNFSETRHVYISSVRFSKQIRDPIECYRSSCLQISRFTVNKSFTGIVENSEEILFTKEVPGGHHWSGQLRFGPTDGYLYIAMGDGGNPTDSQDLESLSGKILRIDVNTTNSYVIPPNNPFIFDPDARDEIWSSGFRNPWRFSIDRENGDLLIPDVGDIRFEEVNYDRFSDGGGKNFGWNIFEGHFFSRAKAGNYFNPNTSFYISKNLRADDKIRDLSKTKGSILTFPSYEYPHTKGCSVAGGEVYRGNRFPKWHGVYIFSDLCTGVIYGLKDYSSDTPKIRVIAYSRKSPLERDAFGSFYHLRPASLGSDFFGEIYFLDLLQNNILRLSLPEDFDLNWKNVTDMEHSHFRNLKKPVLLKDERVMKLEELSQIQNHFAWDIYKFTKDPLGYLKSIAQESKKWLTQLVKVD